jgi:hypothetical protein
MIQWRPTHIATSGAGKIFPFGIHHRITDVVIEEYAFALLEPAICVVLEIEETVTISSGHADIYGWRSLSICVAFKDQGDDAWALTPTLVLCYFFAGAAGVTGAVTAGLAAGAAALGAGFTKL